MTHPDHAPAARQAPALAASLLAAALLLPGVQARAETAPENGAISLRYLDYEDSQPGLDRIHAHAPSVSVLAPVGSALLGMSVGQHIDWPTPGGKVLKLTLLAVEYQPEAAGDVHL